MSGSALVGLVSAVVKLETEGAVRSKIVVEVSAVAGPVLPARSLAELAGRPTVAVTPSAHPERSN